MEQYEMNRSRPSGDVLRERARLNGRILHWMTLAVVGILVGTTGFVLDGLSRWELSGEQAMERTETRRVNSISRGPPVRLARKRSANRITLSSWEFERAVWDLIVSRLAGAAVEAIEAFEEA